MRYMIFLYEFFWYVVAIISKKEFDKFTSKKSYKVQLLDREYIRVLF